MSYYGRKCLLEIARCELDLEFWTEWSDRPHPDEIRAILDKEDPIDVIKRPLKPTWTEGEWILIAPNFEIRPAKPRWVKNRYRITFSIRDYRSGGRTVQRQLREDPENITTLQLLKDHAPGEPEKIPHGIVKKLPSTIEARHRYADARRSEDERRRRRTMIERLREAKYTDEELARLEKLMVEIETERRIAA